MHNVIFLLPRPISTPTLNCCDDDEGVEKDQGLPGMFSVHLVEKIWILVNFIKREDSFDIRPGHFYW